MENDILTTGIALIRAMSPVSLEQLERELQEQVVGVTVDSRRKYALDFLLGGVNAGYTNFSNVWLLTKLH